MKTRMTNRKLVIILSSTVAVMLGAAFAAVPLYDYFCRVTGYGGTISQKNISDTRPDLENAATIELRFDAHVHPGLPWQFTPEVSTMAVKVGEVVRFAYIGKNISSETMTAQAIFNGTPHKAAQYFNKTECFCFSEQTLAPGQEQEFYAVVQFDPQITADPNTHEVRQFTVSYQFFPLETSLPANMVGDHVKH